MPNQMGEIFKVLIAGKNVKVSLMRILLKMT